MSDTPRKIVETVIAGMKANYSQLKTLEAIVEETTLDSTVEKEEVKTLTSPSGGSLTLRLAPKTTREWKFYLDGAKVRRDEVQPGLGEQVKETMLFRDGMWTQYAPESKMAWLRRPDQMSGIGLVNIRDVGSLSLTESVLDVLQRDAVATAQIIHSSQGHNVLEIATTGPNRENTWLFDPRYGYLPTRRITHFDDGSMVATVTYQSVLAGTTWLPLEEKTMTYKKGKDGRPTSLWDDKWKQCRTLNVKKIIAINKPISEEFFTVAFPDGTTVRDAAKKEEYIVGQTKGQAGHKVPPIEGRRGLRLTLLTVCAILALCAIFLVRRRFRVSEQER